MDTVHFEQLERELKVFNQIMNTASDNILDSEVSKYPIFVAHQHELEIGVPLNSILEGVWNIHASSLEEFVAKQIIESDKIDSFLTNYKDPKKYFCIFVVGEIGAKFIFLPKPKTDRKT
jgi:hypothetical protein